MVLILLTIIAILQGCLIAVLLNATLQTRRWMGLARSQYALLVGLEHEVKSQGDLIAAMHDRTVAQEELIRTQKTAIERHEQATQDNNPPIKPNGEAPF